MSIYGYGYGTNDGQNALDWNYYRGTAGGRPANYPIHLPWPPQQGIPSAGGSDYETTQTPFKETRTDRQRFYDYVDKGKFGVSDRTITQGIGAIMPGGFIMANDTDRAYGLNTRSSGVASWLTGTGLPGDMLEEQARSWEAGDGFQSRYGENYFGPGTRQAARMNNPTPEQRERVLDMYTGLAHNQSLTDATRAGAPITADTENYLNSLSVDEASDKMNNLGLSTLNYEGEKWANDQLAANVQKTQSEVDQLQQQVNQAKGINQLAAEKDGFGEKSAWANNTVGITPTGDEPANPGYGNNLAGTQQTVTTETFSPSNNGNSDNYRGGGGDNYGYGGDNSGYGGSSSGFGGHEDGTDASDAAAADQGEW